MKTTSRFSSKRLDNRRLKTLSALTAVLMLAGMVSYFHYVIIPGQDAASNFQQFPSGNFSDLYPRWFGSRELLLRQRDPYSPAVTADIQRGYYGHQLEAENASDPRDEQGFAYPLFIVFLLAPTVSLQFQSVQVWYICLAVALSIASVWCWTRALGAKWPVLSVTIASLLFIGSFPFIQSLYLQQPVLVVASLVAFSSAFVATGNLSAAGVMLAFAMIKPQTAAPSAVWLLVWSLSRWRERKVLFLSFAVTMALLIGGSELLLDGWIPKWLGAARRYTGYAARLPSPLSLIFGSRIGIAVSLLLVAAAGIFCWSARRDPVSSNRFRLATPLTLAVNMVVNPLSHGYDLLLFMSAVLLCVDWRDEFRNLSPFERAVVILSGFLLAWQWVGALVVSGTRFVSPSLAYNLRLLPAFSVLLSPIPLLTSLLIIGRRKLQARFRPRLESETQPATVV
jgi:hypothetical protein